MSHGRAMLIASKLPLKFYGDAQLTATYLWNREYHDGWEKTPYELIYDRRPDVSNLVPFGYVGFSSLRKEIRDKPLNNGKLEKTAVRCRLLGYGDDDDSEEVAGYKILVEADPPYVTYSKHVKWHVDLPMTQLDSFEPVKYSENVLEELFGSPYVTSDEEFVPEILEESSEGEDDEALDDVNGELEMQHEDTPITNGEDLDSSVDDLQNLTNMVHNLYDPILDSERFVSEGLDSETLMFAFLAMTDGIPVPLSERDVLESAEKQKWIEAMDIEMAKIKQYGTYELVDLPDPTDSSNKTNIIKSRWVYRKKLDSKGNIIEYKARLVAKGFTQKYGIDFMETFAPVAKLKSIRTALSL